MEEANGPLEDHFRGFPRTMSLPASKVLVLIKLRAFACAVLVESERSQAIAGAPGVQSSLERQGEE